VNEDVLAPIGEDLMGKVVIEGDGVTAVENETKKTIPLPPIWVVLPLQVELGRSLLEPKSKEPRPQGGALKPKFSKPKTEIPKAQIEFDRP